MILMLLFSVLPLFSQSFLTLHVDAKDLDYSSTDRFLKTLAKHPRDGGKQRDIGHAWITLEGEGFYFSGGQSGEISPNQTRYFDRVFQLLRQGDPNPARALFEVRKDGFLEEGGGCHKPSFSLRIPITDNCAEEILHFIGRYDFSTYSLSDSQCCTFVCKVAALAGLELECKTTLEIEQMYKGRRLWSNPQFRYLTFGSPEVLERSLKAQAMRGTPLREGHYRRK